LRLCPVDSCITSFLSPYHIISYHISSIPTKDDIACGTAGFENICEQIDFAGLNDTTFRGGEWTIFLPNNDAVNDDMIATMFYESLEYNAYRPFLKNLLLTHSRQNATIHRDELSCFDAMVMTSGRVSRTLCEDRVPMFQRGGGNPDTALPAITDFDIPACNGVVHVVDKLILA
jgi:Fasciclin domain